MWVFKAIASLFLQVIHIQFLQLFIYHQINKYVQRFTRWVATSLAFNKNYDASVFETTIRVVGGLLGAYDLSGDNMFLEKAKDIADRLLPAWGTPSGIPYNIINLAHGNAHNPGWTGGDSFLADSGTEQLEFIALTQRTGEPKYQQKVSHHPTLIACHCKGKGWKTRFCYRRRLRPRRVLGRMLKLPSHPRRLLLSVV